MGQDAHYGRDAADQAGSLVKVGSGRAGFDLTKISNSGRELPADALPGDGPDDWACTRDNVTGLLWELKRSEPTHYRSINHRYSFSLAESGEQENMPVPDTTTCGDALEGRDCNTSNYLKKLNEMSLCGYQDWRLPDKKQLLSILDFGVPRNNSWETTHPYIIIDTHRFNQLIYTNSLYSRQHGSSWAIHYSTDSSMTDIGSSIFRSSDLVQGQVIASRSDIYTGSTSKAEHCLQGSSPSNPDDYYRDNDDGTITDIRTGLMWKKCSEGQVWNGISCTGIAYAFTWNSALRHASVHSYANYSDWRMPNVKELVSLVEFCRVTPSINTKFFPNTPATFFWTSSPPHEHWNTPFAVTFDFGRFTTYRFSLSALNIRLVRDGDAQFPQGSLKVVIQPEAAAVAGGQWRRQNWHSSAWLDSGAVMSSLSASDHTVEFKDVDGWFKPDTLTCTVQVDQTTTCTGTYIQDAIIEPAIRLTGNMDFGTVPLGQTATRVLTVHNYGNAPLTVEALRFPLGFSGNWGGGVIPGRSSRDVVVTFSPVTIRDYSGTIEATSNADRGENTIACSGLIRASAVHLAGDLHFGNVDVGNSSTRTLTLSNLDSVPITIDAISYPEGFSGDWHGGSIAPGTSQAVSVTFQPTALKKYSGEIHISSNAVAGANPLECSGVGTGYIAEGYLFVSIEPWMPHTAFWRRLGTTEWRQSRDGEYNVPTGRYELEFSDLPGWLRPQGGFVDIEPNTASHFVAVYAPDDGFGDRRWLTSFYVAYWNRAADPHGLAYWRVLVEDATLTIPEIAENFALSEEAKALYPYFRSPETATDEDRIFFIQSVYANLLNRTVPEDDAGLRYWVNELRVGNTTPGAVIGHIIYAAIQENGPDWSTIWNKILVAEHYTSRFNMYFTDWSDAVQAAARTILADVSDDPATVHRAHQFVVDVLY
ncbi:MAG: DUF1566 domain-containing protein [Desulfovibrionales bacterium]|nr:MAG: DUF1566 domain-containing protein [Desulfovibrionales bacterium]